MIVSAVWETGKLDTIGIPETLRERGHRVQVVAADRVDEEDVLERAPTLDVVYCRFANQPRAIEVSSGLAARGTPVVGGGRGVDVARNQVLTLAALQRDGLPVPQSVVVSSDSQLEEAMADLDWPVVTKSPFTVGGVGVELAFDGDDLKRHLDGTPTDDRRLVIQRFYAEAAGEDIRLFVVGGTVVGSIRRVARAGEFRANLWLGATAWPSVPSQTEARLATEAAASVDLDVAGVDILRTREGPLVSEVNPKPGITGMDRAVDAIVDLIEARGVAVHCNTEARRSHDGSRG